MICRVCDHAGDGKCYVALEMFFGLRTRHEYYQCPHCGCLQLIHVPDDIETFYGPSYYSFKDQKYSTLKKLLISYRNRFALHGNTFIGRMIFSMFPTDQFYFMKRLKKQISIYSRILDIGCGSGKLLLGLKLAGFKNVTGVDPFIDDDVVVDGEILVKKAQLFDIDTEFDLMMFHHSFEHISEPEPVLRYVKEHLSPQGTCIIRIPVVASYAWRRYGTNWVQLDAPRHLYLHTPKSITILAQKAGLVVDDIVYDSTAFQFWGSEQYERDIPLMDKRSHAISPRHSIFTRKDIAEFETRAKKLNEQADGDQAIFYLRKAGT